MKVSFLDVVFGLLLFLVALLGPFPFIYDTSCYSCHRAGSHWCLYMSDGEYECVSPISFDEKQHSCFTNCDDAPTCLLGSWFWSRTICQNLPLFYAQLVGALIIWIVCTYVFYDCRYNDCRVSSCLSPSGIRTSRYCYLCGVVWTTSSMSSSLSLPISFFSFRRGDFVEEKMYTERNLIEIMRCPYHNYRETVQFLSSTTFLLTFSWFFTWTTPQPQLVFGFCLFLCFALSYLPFCYFLSQFKQRVEYAIDVLPNDETVNGGPYPKEVIERNVDLILDLANRKEGDEVVCVGNQSSTFRILDKDRKFESSSFLFLLPCFPVALTVFYQNSSVSFTWTFLFLIIVPILLIAFRHRETVFCVPVVCSKSLIFIYFGAVEIKVFTIEELDKTLGTDFVFLADYSSSSANLSLFPCRLTNGENQLSLPIRDGALEWSQTEFQNSVVYNEFPPDLEGVNPGYYQFEGFHLQKEFQKLPWFQKMVSCDHLEPPLVGNLTRSSSSSSSFLLKIVVLGCFITPFVGYNLFFSGYPFGPLLIYFIGVVVVCLLNWSVIPERLVEFPSWSHLIFPKVM